MLGDLFKYRNETSRKSELVIFLRPTVLVDASVDADLRDFRAAAAPSRRCAARRTPARGGAPRRGTEHEPAA